jgi:FkbM family methyltransferase
MRQNIKKLADSMLRPFDLELRRFRNTLRARRAALLDQENIDLFLDFGANKGQHARELRSMGFRGDIVSFEPLPDAYQELLHSMASDPRWHGRQLALGASDGETVVNIAGNSASSSILPMLKTHEEAAPESRYVDTVLVPMAKLDTISAAILTGRQGVHLKIDVQGYEREVLRGAAQTLAEVSTIECEMSLAPLYTGQALLPEVVRLLDEQGFRWVWMERGFIDPRTSRLLQVEALFRRGAD